jgi:PAS domain S-box-containing protein
MQAVDTTGKTSQRGRPTIGLLIENVHDAWSNRVWLYAADAALQQDANMVCFPARILCDPRGDGFWGQANILYELIGAARLDGLIAMPACLGMFVGPEEIEKFCKKFRLPLVSLEMAFDDIPHVLSNDYLSMREAVIHLVEFHARRRLLFDLVMPGHSGQEERYRAYAELLAEYGLELDDRLVFRTYGRDIFAQLLDERQLRPGLDFDAVVASDDSAAYDALGTLQARGIRVPGEVAIIGFDDRAIARTVTPSLTSVRPPYQGETWKAVEMLLAMIEGKEVTHSVALTGDLIVRESCGCSSPTVRQARVELAPAGKPERIDLSTRRELILAAMQAAMRAPAESDSDWAERLLDDFSADLLEPDAEGQSSFVAALGALLQRTASVEGDVRAWHGPLSALHQHILSCLAGDGAALPRAESLLHQARVLVGERAQRAQVRQAFLADQQAQLLQEVGQALVTTHGLVELADVLARELPRLAIPSCSLALYEEAQPYEYPQPAPESSWLIMAYNEEGRVELDASVRRFPSHLLAPNGLWPPGEGEQPTPPCSLLLEPLYFREQQLGFALFEVGPRDGAIYNALRTQISSALQGTLLVQRVQEHAAEVARQKYILDTFMDNVPDDIYFKDLNCRIIRVNKAHARRLGFSDPAEEIGKSDLDFFPNKEEARAKYDEEQEIIRTGQPILNAEERLVFPDGRVCWSLITKMPLRNERGAIIGTFGTSRDITELKRTQQALERANQEIGSLNEQLKEENLRMSAELDIARRLQEMILPSSEELDQIEGVDVVGYMKPADEVGGDYYDVLKIKGGMLHIGIGDVTGHGLESGVLMLMTQTAIRTLIEHGETDPVKFVTTLNSTIYKNAQRMKTKKILTFSLIQHQRGQLKIVGQHESVLVVRYGGHVEMIDTMDLGFPIGLDGQIDRWIAEATVRLGPQDSAVLYTDGIVEACNEHDELYGLERLCSVLGQHWYQSPAAMRQAVIEDVERFVGKQKLYDDIVLVVLKQKP